MEISHFSHEHPLTLCTPEDTSETCNGCSRPIFDLGYVCYDCGFLLDEKCAELPQKAHHRLHPEHPLALLFNSSETFKCSICKKTGSGFAFQCRECQYTMDVTCFLKNQPYLDLPPEGKTRKLQHFSHDHALTLRYLTKQSRSICKGCKQEISGPTYCCKECDQLTLHKSCAQLPRQMKHPFHPLHSFTLFPEPPYCGARAICDACKKTLYGFVYHCDQCSFDLHLLCACPTPSLKHEKHDHPLTFFGEINRPASCDLCGKPCRNNFYRCASCDFDVHSTCLPFASSVKHKHHSHPLKLKDSTPKDYSSKIRCAACEKKISPEARAYYCAECSYGVHLECVVSEDQDQVDRGKLREEVARIRERLDAIDALLK